METVEARKAAQRTTTREVLALVEQAEFALGKAVRTGRRAFEAQTGDHVLDTNVHLAHGLTVALAAQGREVVRRLEEPA